MRVFFRTFGAPLFHLLAGAIRLGFMFFNWTLDRVYGAPVVSGPAFTQAPAPRHVAARVVPSSARDFQPTVQVVDVAQPAQAVPAALGPAKPAAAQEARRALPVSDRVRTAQLCGPQGIVFGMMWLYLYPDLKIARRVLKVTDQQLARSLKKDRFFFADVPFEPLIGYKPLMDQLHTDCKALLDQRKPVTREKKAAPYAQQRPSAKAASVRPAPAPQKAAPAVVAAPLPSVPPPATPAPVLPSGAPEVVAASTPRRRVRGDEYRGVVTVAGQTTRNGEGGASYETFCLTINDGNREVPLFGTELERQARDLQIKPGDQVQVIFMGKQPTTVPGQTRPSYKNLYQLTRI